MPAQRRSRSEPPLPIDWTQGGGQVPSGRPISPSCPKGSTTRPRRQTSEPTRRTPRGRGTESLGKAIDDCLVTLEEPTCTAHEIGIRPNATDLSGQRIDDQLVHARAMHSSDRLSLVGKVTPTAVEFNLGSGDACTDFLG